MLRGGPPVIFVFPKKKKSTLVKTIVHSNYYNKIDKSTRLILRVMTHFLNFILLCNIEMIRVIEAKIRNFMVFDLLIFFVFFFP